MTQVTKTTALRESYILAAAKRLADLLHHWNVIDEHDLVVQDDCNDGTPYHHVSKALTATLKLLGITEHEQMDFYDMVTTGMTPVEACQRIIDHRPED